MHEAVYILYLAFQATKPISDNSAYHNTDNGIGLALLMQGHVTGWPINCLGDQV